MERVVVCLCFVTLAFASSATPSFSPPFDIPDTPPSKILMVITIGSRSHKNTLFPLAKALALKGHQVTFVNPHPPYETVKNLEEISPPKLAKAFYDVFIGNKTTFKDRIEGRWFSTISHDLPNMSVVTCDAFLQSEETRHLWQPRSKNDYYDLVIIDAFWADCSLALGWVHDVPVLNLHTTGLYAWMAAGAGNPNLIVYKQDIFAINPSDPTEFFQRLLSTIGHIYWRFRQEWIVYPQLEEMIRRVVGPDMPSMKEMERNAGITLLSTHFAMEQPLPYMPSIIEIGGFHLLKPKPLPKDISEFADSASKGFVLVSFGSVVHSKDVNDAFRRAIVETFSHIPYRILFKWDEGENLHTSDGQLLKMPPNVLVKKWLPQMDVLAHPNIKLFVTQGGRLSTMEALYYGVPMIVIPFITDQDGHAFLAQKRKMGLKFEARDIYSPGDFAAAINTVLSDHGYAQNAKKYSQIFRDQPDHPLNRAVYWTEYLIRHKGASHILSEARLLPWYKFYLLDVWVVIITIIIAICAAFISGISCMCYYITRPQVVKKVKQR